jgi:predicted nuclease with TOPRIM domain
MRWTWRGSVMAVVLAGIVTGLSGVSGAARAQEPPKYDDLKKMYEAAKAQLQSQQDARNELAKRNEELGKQVAALQLQLGEVVKERDELARQAAGHAEKTYELRSTLAAWQEFMKRYPTLHARWKVFLEAELLRPANEPPMLAEPSWPFRLEG